jgi:acyl transferase domain-containing protein/NAD(P)-dependent dehydrogenase (short-subunit alcohol dehydrogenase family)/acyl carrier protein
MSIEELLTNHEGIAIIGLAGRFPGARNIDEFWQNVCNGVESISFFSEEELLASGVAPNLIHDPRYVRARGILDDVEFFDASFFGYSPKEAAMMDPQQRLFLECAWEVLEQAGMLRDGGLPDTSQGLIGVYAGQSASSYLLSNVLANPTMLAETDTLSIQINNDKDFLATRTSYKLNLEGPSMTIQTACSTSLVAVHMACQGLLGYECNMALAGGATIFVPQKTGYLYQEEGISSPDGHCRAFDADARGTVAGSGVGIVALKRLEDAIADRDTIHAVIRGSALNNDGAAKVGYTAPSVEGQAKVIAQAIAMAGVEPGTISYVETHGTGTALGDPIEIEALTQAFGGRERARLRSRCAIGSVKTNIGHLDAAAGIAGLIKTVLSLKHGVIPPSLHFQRPNPEIDFAQSPFYVNTHLKSWKRGSTPRRAGVSSFGIGGTNAHVILEEALSTSPRRDSALRLSAPSEKPHLIVLSAKTASALETMTEQLATYVQTYPDAHLADVAYTLQMGRKSFSHRRAFVAQDLADMLDLLSPGDSQTTRAFSQYTDVVTPETKLVAFLFSGQGAQYVNMGRELYEEEPAFRQQVDTCAQWLIPHLHCDLRAIIYPPHRHKAQSLRPEGIARDQLDHMSLAQPAIFVIEYALAQLWIQRGVRPAAMIGHSIGEYVAACLAGVLSLEDALSLVALRGRLMDQLPSGGMLAVSLPEEKILPLLGTHLSFAVHNSPTDCVVSGPADAIASLEQYLREQKITCQLLRVSRASHSQMVEPVLAQFTNAVEKCHLHPPKLPYISNLTGKWITEEETTDTGYWARHWRQTVRFVEGLQLLLDSANMVLLEVGPGHSLSTLARRAVRSPADRIILSSLRHPQTSVSDRAFLLNTCGRLWCAGVAIDWSQFSADSPQRRIPLPTYPFERERYWISPIGTERAPAQGHQANAWIHLRKEPDLARWFSLSVWKQSPLLQAPSKQDEPKDCWLIFTDSTGLGTRLGEHLVGKGFTPFRETVILVRVGTQFGKINDWEYTIRPDSREDYDSLLKDINTHSLFPTRIVHLWTVMATDHIPSGLDSFEMAQTLGFYSLLFLTQALGEQSEGGGSPTNGMRREGFYAPPSRARKTEGRKTPPYGGLQPQEIVIISNNLQEVIGREVLCPARATALGVGKIARYEYPYISFRSIDIVLPEAIGQAQGRGETGASPVPTGGRVGTGLAPVRFPTPTDEEQLVEQMLVELRSRSSDMEVAYRGPHRWVRSVEPTRLEKVPEEEQPLGQSHGGREGKAQGLRQQGVYLITGGLGGIGLTLASDLARTMKAKLVLTGRTALPAREEWDHRLATFAEQDAVTSNIRQVRRLEELGAEVLVIQADVTDMEQMQAVIQQVRQRFGELHGVIHTAGLIDDGLIQMKMPEVVTKVLAPKVKGTLVLEAVLKDVPLDFLVLCSSLAALIGQLGRVDYCAANTFLDSFAFYHTAQRRVRTISINWDGWQEVGMAMNRPIPSQKALQSKTEGQELFQNAVLPQEGIEVFRRIIAHKTPSQVLVSTSDILARLRRAEVALLPASAEGEQAPDTVPTTLSGMAHQRPHLQTAYVAPQNETQQIIADLWQKLLGIEKVGIHDSFIDLGGHSLHGVQLIIRLRDTFQVDISLRSLFEKPTVAGLALMIMQKKAEFVGDELLLRDIEDIEQLTDDEVQTLLEADTKQVGREENR